MSIKLFIARRIANRIANRNRTERRTLRDHVRQQLGQLRHDEKRVRGLRLYVAWSQHRGTNPRNVAADMSWSHTAQPAV